MTILNGPRVGAGVAAVGVALLLSGCTSSVTGSAVRPGVAEGVEGLHEPQLEEVLLPIDELNATVGASDLAVSTDLTEMGDHSDDVSDQDCLGAVFSAEDPVYADSEWLAVRDQTAAEPGDDNQHWVQQTAVLFPRPEQAQGFFEESRSSWQGCARELLTITDGSSTYLWQLRDVVEAGDMITQSSSQEESGGWLCQHAMSAVSNVVVEAWACGYQITDQAAAIADALVANVDEN